MNKGFITRGVLLAPLCLAYLSCFALPRAYALLPELTAGPLIGLSAIGLNLYRYFTLSEEPHVGKSPNLSEPLLTSHTRGKETRLAASHAILQFVVSLLIAGSCMPMAVLPAIILVLEIVLRIHLNAVLGGLFAGAFLTLFQPGPILEGFIFAVSSGVLTHTLIAHYLAAWDDVVLSKQTFALGALSLILLFISFSTLEFTI